MSHPILRLNDGFDHPSPELSDEVKALQTELKQEGLGVEVDGLFGRDIDFFTTGRDYSKELLNRAGFFQLHGWP